MREATVCYLLRENGKGPEVLLGPRRSLFKDRIWNGPGGGLRKGEGIFAGSKREVREEVKVEVDLSSVSHFATLDSYHPYGSGHQLGYRVYFSYVSRWSGEPQVTDAFWELHWVHLNDLPYTRMMPDVIAWMPLVLSNKNVDKLLEADIYYADKDLKILERGSFKFVDRPKGWPKRKP
jgi:8-oxo-dGTP diphosphatase